MPAGQTDSLWTNPPIILFHGTDSGSAANIQRGGINLGRCRKQTDFGCGFYTTTKESQAWGWAENVVRRKNLRPENNFTAAVLKFTVDRYKLAKLEGMTFILAGEDGSDYWTFVGHCRNKFNNLHNRHGSNKQYQCVSGPVSLWKRIEIIAESDQFSFHDDESVAILGKPEILERNDILEN